MTGATSATVANGDNITSSCYIVNNQNYCFYTNGSLLSWGEAREFCETKNSTLPIITDENIDNVFQQFIVDNGTYKMIQNRYVWIGVHARPVNRNTPWHWINGLQSRLFVIFFVIAARSWFSDSWRVLYNLSRFLIFIQSTFSNVRQPTFSKLSQMMWL